MKELVEVIVTLFVEFVFRSRPSMDEVLVALLRFLMNFLAIIKNMIKSLAYCA